MTKQILLQGIIFSLLLLVGCAPKVVSNMTKTYDPLPTDSPIEVYPENSPVPMKAEMLGRTSISDSGVSTKCDSVSVINKIKEEARKAGGNAIVILKHVRPSFWGSTCHQMEAAILNVSDFSDLIAVDNLNASESSPEYRKAMTESIEEKKKKRLLPSFHFAGNFGYGWRTAKTASNLSSNEKDYFENLKNGIIWDISANYYFNDNYGLGLIYSAYSANTDSWASNNDTGQVGKIKTNDMITYIGPAFLMRFSQNQKWIFNINVGLGYIGYASKTTLLSDESKLTGASVGFLSTLGAEYKFSKNWGIGADLSAISGLLGSMTENTNGRKHTIKFPDDEKEGLGHLRLSLGIRYYLK